MILFMLFIVGLSARMIFSAPDDLVEKDYYEKGQAYNADYDAQRNALRGGKLPQVYASPNGIAVIFRESCTYELRLMHPFDASKDIFERGAAQRNALVVIRRSRLSKGTWTADIRWSDKQKQRLRRQIIIR
jgi:hypothetical protein